MIHTDPQSLRGSLHLPNKEILFCVIYNVRVMTHAVIVPNDVIFRYSNRLKIGLRKYFSNSLASIAKDHLYTIKSKCVCV